MRWILTIGLLAASFIPSRLAAQVYPNQYEQTCAAGSTVLSGPTGSSYNPSTGKYHANFCIDANGNISMQGSSVGLISLVTPTGSQTVQQAINALTQPIGGVIYVAPGNYIGPTSIPSNTHLICLGFWQNPASFGGTSDNGTGCHLTYSGNQSYTSITNISINGFWLDFPNAGTGLTLTSVQQSEFIWRIDCATGATCLTLNTTGSGASAAVQGNRFNLTYLNCNASKCLKQSGGSASAFITGNHWGTLYVNGGDATHPLMDFTQFVDGTMDFVYANISATTETIAIFNNSGTTNVDVQADNNVITTLKSPLIGGYTGPAFVFNASGGNYILHADGITQSMISCPFCSTVTTTFYVGGAGVSAQQNIYNGSMCVASAGTGCNASAGVGDISVGNAIWVGSTLFTNLGTPGNGKFVFCSDCTIANPCAGSGTGALAKRLNGVWVCN